MTSASVIYEVNVTVKNSRLAEYDSWLKEHVAQLLELPGFVDARSFHAQAGDDAQLRSVQYRLESSAALDAYVANHADKMRAEGAALFGDDISAERRILEPVELTSTQACLNCGAALEGQYCGSCGQRHRTKMISVWQLLRDVFEDVFDWDSRLWRSLRPLLLAPGKLTTEYLNGRRTHFTPPLRMYLVLSVLFFLLTSLPQLVGFDQRDFINLSTNGVTIVDGNGQELTEQGDSAEDDDNDASACDDISLDVSLPGLSTSALEAKAKSVCTRMYTAAGRRAFVNEFIGLVPKLLIIMLPLIALAGKVLYPFSRRYYVEHLLFYTHYHSFAFFFLIVLVSSFALLDRFAWFSTISDWIVGAAVFYAVYYMYRSLRRVFNQGRLATLFKLSLISFVYMIGSSILMFIGLLFAALAV